MFTIDVQFESWSAAEWARFLSVWQSKPEETTSSKSKGLVLIYEGNSVRKALHSIEGRLEPHSIPWPKPLKNLATEMNVQWVCALRSGALEESLEQWSAQLKREHDMLDQALLLATVIKKQMVEGSIRCWPWQLDKVPIPTRTIINRVFDSLIAQEKNLVVGLYEAGELATALVLHRAMGENVCFDRVVGPARLRDEMGVTSGEFQRDYRHLVDAIEALYGPIGFGVFTEISTFRTVVHSAKPGDWARAIALRSVIVHPVPYTLAIPLGVDATRGMFRLASRMFQQTKDVFVFTELATLIQTYLRPYASKKNGSIDSLLHWLEPKEKKSSSE